jgi:hypothetical protein
MHERRCSGALPAGGAKAPQFDHRPHVGEASRPCRIDQRAGKSVVVDVNGLATAVAD